MTMPDPQQYPWNFYLIDNVEDIVVSLGLKVFKSDHSIMFSCSRNTRCASNFCRETTIEKNHFSKLKAFITNSYLIRQSSEIYQSGIGSWNYAYCLNLKWPWIRNFHWSYICSGQVRFTTLSPLNIWLIKDDWDTWLSCWILIFFQL